jgi:protein transport protein SEC24
VDWGVSVDLFVAVPGYADVATVGTLPALTGGSTYFYPRFNAVKHGEALTEELKRDVRKVFNFDGLMRVRTCAGLKVAEHYGNFYSKNDTDINLAGIDNESGKNFFEGQEMLSQRG